MNLWPRSGTRRKKIVMATLIILASSALFFLGVNYRVYQRGQAGIVSSDQAPQADAILVLGAYIYEGGHPSPILRDRLTVALELYQNGVAPKLLVSGDHGQKNYDEVNAMRRFLEERGVPPEDIFLDHAGFDTYDSLIRARDIFCVKKVVVVTQTFHLRRAVYIGRALGLECHGVPSDLKNYVSINYLRRREMAARIKAFLEVNLSRSPKYGGDTHPITGSGLSTHDQK